MGWRAHLDSNSVFMRGQLSIYMINEFPNNDIEFYIDQGSSEKDNPRQPVMFRLLAQDRNDPNAQPILPITMEEDAARALMEELQRHFGVYVGVDYDRLRKDYDRVADEAMVANGYIRDTLDKILTRRAGIPKRGGDDT